MTEIKGIRICFAAVLFGQLVIGGGISLVAYEYSGQSMILMAGAVTTGFVVLLTGLLVVILQKRLTKLTQNLCDTLDRMMSGDVLLSQIAEEETVDSRIDHRLRRLYEAMQAGKMPSRKRQGGASVPVIGHFSSGQNADCKSENAQRYHAEPFDGR